MGFLNNLLRGPAAIAMKGAEPETGALPTVGDAMPEAISWPTEEDFAGYVNGMYCREYAARRGRFHYPPIGLSAVEGVSEER